MVEPPLTCTTGRGAREEPDHEGRVVARGRQRGRGQSGRSGSVLRLHRDQDPYFVHYSVWTSTGATWSPSPRRTATTASTGRPTSSTTSTCTPGSTCRRSWRAARTSDRKLLATLEKGDMSAQLATGWRPPEVFVAKGRDGKTDIWGSSSPTNFDPNRKYPVIEQVYAGPQGSFLSRRTGTRSRARRRWPSWASSWSRSMGWGRTTGRRRSTMSPGRTSRTRASRPDPVAQAVAAKYPGTTSAGRDLRRLGRRAER